MSTKKEKTNKNTFYFCTLTCYNWIPLFEITNLYDHISKWFKILKSKNIYVVGYVIMPNHMHLILYIPGIFNNINFIIGTGKRFMAYEIVNRLRDLKRNDLLKRLEAGVKITAKKRNKIHQVFQPSFDLKELETEHYILQKLNYIHRNPVSNKYNLVNDFTNFKYSSAGFYELGESNEFDITHYLKVREIIES